MREGQAHLRFLRRSCTRLHYYQISPRGPKDRNCIDCAQAKNRLQRALAAQPSNPTRHITLAAMLELLGDFAGVANCYQNAIALVPGNVGYQRHLEHLEKIETRLAESTH
jgi:hypothetical protein